MYPPWYSQVSGTARLDQGQPPGSRGPGPAIPPPSWDIGPGSAPGPRISSRPAQALPPPPWQKGGQGIAGESTGERWWALALPPAGGTGRSVPLGAVPAHSVAGLEGPPVAATWELGQGEREKEMGGTGEAREKERD